MWSSGTTSSRGAQRGFVLATTLLVTTLLTVMLAASFLLVSAEQRTTDNSLGAARALALAEAGLESYYTMTRGLDTSSTYDSANITLTGGYANVVGVRVRPAGAAAGSPLALWVVRSTGVATTPVMVGQTLGRRTIAQLAQFNSGKLPARAALVALNGVNVTGGNNQTYPVSGADLNGGLCSGNPGGAAADTFAVNVPRGMNGAQPMYSTAHGTVVTVSQYGIPMVDSLPFPHSSNLYDTTHIDWAGLLAGNFIPDYTVPPGPWPAVGGSTYSVGYVNGDVTLPVGQTRGMLVVTGNVNVVNGVHWDGIIIAGGLLNVPNNASYNIHGMVIPGLNMILGQAVAPNALRYGDGANGLPQIQWTWCYTQSATAALSSMVPIKNAWADTWTTY